MTVLLECVILLVTNNYKGPQPRCFPTDNGWLTSHFNRPSDANLTKRDILSVYYLNLAQIQYLVHR